MIAIQKLWKMFFISSKKLFSFWGYLIFVFNKVLPSSPLFLPLSHCFRAWSTINRKVYDVINCLNKNVIINLVWYLEKERRYNTETLSIDRVLNKEHFYGKMIQKMSTKASPRQLFYFGKQPKTTIACKKFF